ncbi:hypothetical protein CFAM422_006789 [Trichoderma lentiforme]|uniref:Uncharacterized protein n=1 Tax=Trichoderma lentiforme TaxID=1567552 RepID=A0A9P4XCA0_9HYPO|nr:hypothetical protein CFAM422_006789 [Trichoderma lentiforme]
MDMDLMSRHDTHQISSFSPSALAEAWRSITLHPSSHQHITNTPDLASGNILGSLSPSGGKEAQIFDNNAQVVIDV